MKAGSKCDTGALCALEPIWGRFCPGRKEMCWETYFLSLFPDPFPDPLHKSEEKGWTEESLFRDFFLKKYVTIQWPNSHGQHCLELFLNIFKNYFFQGKKKRKREKSKSSN